MRTRTDARTMTKQLFESALMRQVAGPQHDAPHDAVPLLLLLLLLALRTAYLKTGVHCRRVFCAMIYDPFRSVRPPARCQQTNEEPDGSTVAAEDAAATAGADIYHSIFRRHSL